MELLVSPSSVLIGPLCEPFGRPMSLGPSSINDLPPHGTGVVSQNEFPRSQTPSTDSGNEGARERLLYTIGECCRRRGLDPYAYLRDILTQLPNATNWQIADLTPEAWAQKHCLATLPQAA